MNFDRLQAKRCDPSDPVLPFMFLPGHLADVHSAAQEILSVTGRQQLQVFGLADDVYANRFEKLVLAATVLHDLGKANDHFQSMVRARGPASQAIRHEWLTMLMLGQPGWREWLSPALGDKEDYDLLRWCVATHHLKDADECATDGAGQKICLLQGHRDYIEALEVIASRLGIGLPPAITSVQVRADSVLRSFQSLRAHWSCRTEAMARLLAAAKATLIAADVAASALPEKNVAMTWVGQRLAVAPTRAEFDALVKVRLDGCPMWPFQEEGGKDPYRRVTFVKAGCGSGKTVLAYHWAARRDRVRRLYMCYPTTGTATEGFRGYLFDEKAKEAKFGARLFHSRAEVDIDRILHVERGDDDDEEAKLASLDAWSTPIVACTVDTVLGAIQSQRRAMYNWPALAQAAFCFDEIHSYDNRMFGKLLRFLRDLPGVPVLLMTASLPDLRLEAIREVIATQNDLMKEIPGPWELESALRYHRLTPADVDLAVRQHLAAGGKVLWVCNTVGRAMKVFDRMADQQPLLYHSHYRYADRVDRHVDVIDAFDPKKNPGRALAITTQVAEMSLDLSATMLVTDFAPIPSLIQRLGRLNRRAEPGNILTMPFVVLPPDDDTEKSLMPYHPDDYGDWPAATRKWLERLGNAALSQHMLAAAWDSMFDMANAYDQTSTWLDLRTSRPDSVRDASVGISVLLERDSATAAVDRKRRIESVLPMNAPKKKDWNSWKRVKGLVVASPDVIEYDEMRGGEWK